MIRFYSLLVALLACVSPLVGQSHTPEPPYEGGPRSWQVTGVETVLNLRASPSGAAVVIGRLEPGAILDNLDGCRSAEGRIWCDVQRLGGGDRGWAAVTYLTPAVAPDGVAHTGPDDSALRAGQGDFDATGTLPCAWRRGQPMAECDFAVSRAGGGYATVVITRPDGRERLVFFRMGVPIGISSSNTDPVGSFLTMKQGDAKLVWVGEEGYQVPDAVVLGG